MITKKEIRKNEKRMKKCELCGAKGRIVQSDNLFYCECAGCKGTTAMLSDLAELVALWNFRIGDLKCIEAVHFGSENLYTWELPKKLHNKVAVGDVVEVETQFGPKWVQIKTIIEEGIKFPPGISVDVSTTGYGHTGHKKVLKKVK